jgi:hypothetical protein
MLLLATVPMTASAQLIINRAGLNDNEQTSAGHTPLPPSLMDQVSNKPAIFGGQNQQTNTQANQQSAQHGITWQSFCQSLVQHIPQQNTQYQEGMDVRGRPVVPADMAGQAPLNLPQEYSVLITVNQAQSLGIQIPYMQLQADTFVGNAVVGTDGSVSFNGQTIATQNVYAMCGYVAH